MTDSPRTESCHRRAAAVAPSCDKKSVRPREGCRQRRTLSPRRRSAPWSKAQFPVDAGRRQARRPALGRAPGVGPDRSLRAWGSDASRSASPIKTRPVASSPKPACRTPPRHRLTTTTTTTETMADDEAVRKEEVEPSTLPPQTIHSPANAAPAPQIRPLVQHRPVRRPPMPAQRPQRNAPIHRRPDRAGLDADR